ncbi:hypothetical protein BN961_02123 [Afipia felis]|uniref:Uncharacterized protein n=1 Tax=Afipia felis TaxID=1035 RepID=A0A090MMS1_AFIFE|nr:hypothetical protein BN961_02123 [Afipia felis]
MTDSALSRLNGMPRIKRLIARLLKPVLMLSVLLAVAADLTGCVTTGTTATDINALCAPWRPIRYSAKSDTPETVKEVRTHNKTGQNLRCWK